VLVVRCCRPQQFADAVRAARDRYPAATITALTHRGHDDMLRAAGVDDVEVVTGRQFGLWRTPFWPLARLRARRFDVVVIPQMDAEWEQHGNVYRLVAAIGARRVVVLPGTDEPIMFERQDFRRFAFWSSCTEKWDAVVLLALLLAACVRRRPAAPPADGGRRRVLHIISNLGVGGAQVQLMQLLERTPPDRYDVDLLVLSAADGDFSRTALTRPDVGLFYLDEWPRLPHSVREVMLRCQAGRYDIVHTWLFFANVVGSAGARFAGVPLIVSSVRNLSVWKRAGWYRKWWWRLADALASRAADVVTVNARALVEDHARWTLMGTGTIEVLHNGLDPARLAFDREESRARLQQETEAGNAAVFVGTVGRLAREKDQMTFLRILAAVRAVRSDVHGVIVGDGPVRSSLEGLAQELGLGGALNFLGQRSDASRLAAGFDLFLLTSRSEGFPNVLLEATFMGVPCVATDIAGNPDVLERAESLFPPGNVTRGAERVLAALADVPRTRRYTEDVRRRALELFSAERSTNAWLALYSRHLLAAPPPEGRAAPASVHLPEAR
jgi:glycosyltransferase involved in cell wall biosynthesis